MIILLEVQVKCNQDLKFQKKQAEYNLPCYFNLEGSPPVYLYSILF